jgi:hypothetical protein
VNLAGTVLDGDGLLVSGGSVAESKPVISAADQHWTAVFYSDKIWAIDRLAGRTFGEKAGQSVATIKAAKNLPNGTWVSLTGKVATAGTDQLGGICYIEEQDRSAGIKVVTTSSVAEGKILDVIGRIDTVGGERQITASQVTVGATGTVPVPFTMTNLTVGGTASNPYEPGVMFARGPSNIGLLIKTWGIVSYVGGASEPFFYIDDRYSWWYGQRLTDGSGHTGVRVYCGSVAKPVLGSFYTVKGISSTEVIEGNQARRILLRKAADLVKLP